MKQNYFISQMCICTFRRDGDRVRINPDYLLRNCVINEDNGFVIDIESKIKFDYVKTVNGQYIISNIDEKVKNKQRVAIFPTNSMFSESQYSEANKIIEKLQNGEEFIDSREISDINDYLNPKKTKKSTTKIKLFAKKKK